MLSKSTKAKRRRNATFLKLISGVRISVLGIKEGQRLYRVWIHTGQPGIIFVAKQVSGEQELLAEYRRRVSDLRSNAQMMEAAKRAAFFYSSVKGRTRDHGSISDNVILLARMPKDPEVGDRVIINVSKGRSITGGVEIVFDPVSKLPLYTNVFDEQIEKKS